MTDKKTDILVDVRNLKKYFQTPYGTLHAVDDVTFTINKGEVLGVVGESGCGKSTLGRTVLGMHPSTGGQIFYKGKDITDPNPAEKKKLRQNMQMIFQDPYASLNPRMTVFSLIADPLKVNFGMRGKMLEAKVKDLMNTVGLAERFMYAYPHELDGGRRQRIGVARALSLDPEFIVCDEPVSALDVSIQAQILNLLQDLQEVNQLTYIFVTHDLSVVKHISNEILVMYMGCMVEKCASDELFENPIHPYTKALLAAIPVPKVRKERRKVALRGEVSSPIDPKPACRFAGRCPLADERCHTENPAFMEPVPGHFVACHHCG